jgi:hypothetical protein
MERKEWKMAVSCFFSLTRGQNEEDFDGQDGKYSKY